MNVATSRLVRAVAAFAIAAGLLGGGPPAAALELDTWFATPGQRAAGRFAAGEHEALIEEAPDAYWEGVGRYGAGDADGAAEAFARALEARGGEGSSTRERDALLYNRATAETRAGRPAEALPLFDELLGRDPTNADALHNRDIARKLVELDEATPRNEQGEGGGESDGGGGEGEPGEGDGSDGERTGDDRSDRTGESGDHREPGDGNGSSGAGEPGENGSGDAAGERTGDGPDSGADDGADDGAAARAGRRAEAEAALEAERRAAAGDGSASGGEGGEGGEGGKGGESAASAADTLTEREQATEQWLRRIPDDPAGLLRRRLERSHRIDYPEVKDGDRPW